MKIAFALNGRPVELEVAADDVLLDVVRAAGWTGTKEGCGVGVCGACTVLVDDAPVSSCLYLAPCAADREVWTVEGLADAEPELRAAFLAHEAVQCGMCTPGQLVSTYALARDVPDASEAEVRGYLAGNLCRCTGYDSIVAAARTYLDRR